MSHSRLPHNVDDGVYQSINSAGFARLEVEQLLRFVLSAILCQRYNSRHNNIYIGAKECKTELSALLPLS